MNSGEALALLTKAALIDPRMKRADPHEWADMATAWADVLDDVTLADAADALRRLQRGRRGTDAPILPGDILDEIGEVVAAPGIGEDLTEQLGMRRALEDAGVTEAEYRAHAHDRAWVEATFGPRREIEA